MLCNNSMSTSIAYSQPFPLKRRCPSQPSLWFAKRFKPFQDLPPVCVEIPAQRVSEAKISRHMLDILLCSGELAERFVVREYLRLRAESARGNAEPMIS